MVPDRGQSETFDTLALIAVTVTIVLVFGTFALGNVDTTEPPLVEVTLEATSSDVTIGHAGGDPINTTEARVIFQGEDGETRFQMDEATIAGDGDGEFERGESLSHGHTFADSSIRVVIVHLATNSVLVDDTVDVETSAGGGATPSNQAPTATFTYSPSNPAAGQEIEFNASEASDPDGTITKYEWDWTSNGTYDTTGMIANHTYDDSGDHNVTLRVTDGNGATDTVEVTVSLTNVAPTALFTYSPATPGTGQTVTFDGSSSTDLDGSILSYEWDWDDDGTYEGSGETATHSFNSVGIHTVTLKVTDDDALSSSTTEVITVNTNDAPEPDFTYSPSNPSAGTQVMFDASNSSDPDGVIASYEWDWDDDGTYEGTGVTANHTFGSTGSYPVILKVTDGLGGWNTTTETVSVSSNTPPTAAFSATTTSWYSQAFSYRKAIEFDHQQIPADQSDFPVLIDVTDTDLKNEAQNDAGDVLFTTGNGTTKLDHEIESYDSSNGHLVAWVRVPMLNSSAPNTTIYLYYGDADAPNQENPSEVWDSDFAVVQHLDESSGEALDSTGNNNDGNVDGADQGESGKVGTSYDFTDNQNDAVEIPDDPTLDLTDEVTISAWIKPESIDDWNRIVAKSHDSNHWPYTHYGLLFDSDDNLRLELADCATQDSWCQEDENGATTVSTGEWTYAAVSYDGSDLRVYFDGTLDGSRTESFPIVTNDMPLTIGKSGFDADYFDGRIDEVRVSSTARSADWIATQFNNTADPAGFHSVGAQETARSVEVNASASSDPDGSISSYDWDWTDDDTWEGTGVNASHAYGSTGTYNLSLRVTDGAGATDEAKKKVAVTVGNAVPSASFSLAPNDPVVGELVSVNASGSSDPDGSVDRFYWDWTNDGGYEDSGETATHEFDQNATILLRITDDGGKNDTTTRSITVSRAVFLDETSTANLGSTPGGGVIVFADFDDDGFLDVFMNDNDYTSDSVLLRENDGDLTFTNRDNRVTVDGGRGAGTGDYDNDGDPDLVIGVGQKLNENQGNFNFDSSTVGGSNNNNEEALMFVDVDGDGDLDVWSPGEDYLWHENTDGGWTSHATMPGLSTDRTSNGEGATVADIDNDGNVDFLFANTSTGVDAWLNDGDYTYTYEPDVDGELGLPEDVGNHENMEWAWGDYDSDGDLDVYVSGHENEGLYRNDGTGSFTEVTSSADISESDPDGAAWGDYDNDGTLDLVLADSDGNSDLYNNDGDGTFTEVDGATNLDADGALGSTVGWFDADNDGDLDIVTNDPVTLWNNTRDDREHLRVIVRGNTSPKTPIAAQVELYENDTGTLVGHRELLASQNQLQPPLRQHFGVDPAASYDVRVRFPSGAVVWRNGTVPNDENVTIGGNTLEQTIRVFEPDLVTFTEQTGSANLGSSPGGGALVFADFDDDGYLDVFMNDDDYGDDDVRLRENDGDLTFTDHDSAVSVDGGRGAGAGDVDNDGDPDLIVGVGQRLNENTGDFSFSGSTVGETNNEEALMFVDVDGDGDLDIWSPGEDQLWHEQTSTGWASHDTVPGDGVDRTENGEGATAADINGDGRPDLIWAQDSTDVDVFLSDGDGTYTHHWNVDGDFGLPEDVGNHENMEWAWGDYDSDGDMDVYISGADNEGLYRNDGTGSFTEVTSSAGIVDANPDGAAWGDYDNDGDLDLVVAQQSGVSHLYQNQGDGTFEFRGSPAGIGHSGDLGSTIGWFDADNDGDLDLATNDPATIWRNNLDDDRYLRVMVKGNGSTGGSPKTPIGAQVEVYENDTGTLVGHRELLGSQNQLQPPLRQHFGVDPMESYDVKVQFPSGTVVWRNDTVPAEAEVLAGETTLQQTIKVREPNEWTMFMGAPSNDGVIDTAGPTADLGVKWSTTDSGGFGEFKRDGASVVDGRVHVGNKNGRVYALHAENGSIDWTVNTGGEVLSTPAVRDETVYIGTKAQELLALDAATGTEDWSFSTSGEVRESSPTISDDTVYVGTKDGPLYAIWTNGTKRWQSTVPTGEMHVSPAVHGGMVYVADTSGDLYAFHASNGTHVWTFSEGSEVKFSSPAVKNGRVFVGDSGSRTLYAVDAGTGDKEWEFDPGEEFKGTPAIHDGTVYVGTKSGTLYALDADADTPTTEWSFTDPGEIHTSAVVADETVYVGDKAGTLHAVDATSGEELTSYATGAEILSPPVVKDGTVYIGTKGGTLYALHNPPLFADDFDRAPSNSLDEGWSETESEADDARIAEDRLDFEPDNNDERPSIEHTFPEQTNGTVRLSFTFNMERTGSESWYSANIQLGDGDAMVDPATNHDQGVAVNLKWGGDADAGVSDMTDEEGFGYTSDGADNQIGVVSGDAGSNDGGDARVNVTVDLDANTYDIVVTGDGLVSGSGTATDVSFENDVDIDTLRVFLDEVEPANFDDLELDDVEVDRIE